MLGKMILRCFALLVVAGSFPAVPLAAQDAPSVAEAARRSRQQKQTSTKPAQVVDNDTLAPSKTAPATPAADSASPPSAPAATPASDSKAQTGNGAAPSAAENPAAGSDNDAKKKAQIDSLKQQIAEQQLSVNLLQREIALEQDTFLKNPDYAHDKAGKAKLDSMRTDLDQQQAALAELKAKLAELAPQDAAEPPPPAPPKS
jgi:uncharacterized coiled-coil protein SlyX